MNVATSSLFSQLLSLVDRNRFANLVCQTGSEGCSKGFASWDHFVVMLFCLLAQAKSLREIDAGLSSWLMLTKRTAGKSQVSDRAGWPVFMSGA